jgi:hypothetical protein
MRRRIRFQRQKGKAVLLLRGLPGQNAGMAQAGYAETQGAGNCEIRRIDLALF